MRKLKLRTTADLVRYALDKRLIELVVAWPGLTGGLARMADALRLFVITWDPLAGIVQRPSGFATTNGAGADLEIVVYLPTWSLVRTATARNDAAANVAIIEDPP